MKRCFFLALALLFIVPEAFAQQRPDRALMARPQAETAPQTSPVVVRGDDFLQLDRFYGYFNDALPTQGYGYADIDGLNYTKVADYPDTQANLPLGGAIGPDGRFWFIGRVGGGASYGLFSFDLMDTSLAYEEIVFQLDEFLEFGTDELPAGLAYDPVSNSMVMASWFCDLDDEGAYRQTLLYSIDIDTGVPTYLRDLQAPNATGQPGNEGVCLYSFTWDGGDEIFGVDFFSDSMVQINATTGELVDSYSDPFLFEVCYVQDSAFNHNDGFHYLMPHTCGSSGGGGPFYGGVYQCGPEQGCVFQGFINDNEPDGYEMLLAAFLWEGLLSSSEEGASAQGVRLDVYPNPMASQSTVVLSLDAPQAVTVAVYDLLGRQVATLHEGVTSSVELSFAGQGLPSGVYFVSARGETFSTTQKVVIAR